MEKILIATHNKAKLAEIKFGLNDLKNQNINIVSLNDLGVKIKPVENGKTFKENAEIKAHYYGNLTNLPTIADDGGLVIPYLNNEPGVKSRRWLGREATDEELIKHTLLHLRGVNHDDRTAYLQTCVCFYYPQLNNDSGQVIIPRYRGTRMTRRMLKRVQHDNDILICKEEKIKGYIAEKPSPRRIEGYPYRALLVVEKYNKYYDELTREEHQKINHRLIALTRLTKKIKNLLIE